MSQRLQCFNSWSPFGGLLRRFWKWGHVGRNYVTRELGCWMFNASPYILFVLYLLLFVFSDLSSQLLLPSLLLAAIMDSKSLIKAQGSSFINKLPHSLCFIKPMKIVNAITNIINRTIIAQKAIKTNKWKEWQMELQGVIKQYQTNHYIEMRLILPVSHSV